MDYLNILYKRAQDRYKKRKLKFNPTELKKDIDTFIQQANKNYWKLLEPKICSLKAYISLWVNEEIGKDIAKKNFTSINLTDPPNEFKSSAKFYLNYPPSKFKAGKIDKNTNLYQMEKDWFEMVKERNSFSIKKGFKSSLDMALKNSKIPKSEYDKFLKNNPKLINFYKHLIPIQKSDNFCFICNTKFTLINQFSELIKIIEEKESFFKKNKNKIRINLGNYSETSYLKENDNFVITIKKGTSLNHQILDLIHELAHVASMINILKQDKFIKPKIYTIEKQAIKKEIVFIKKYIPGLLVAQIGHILQIICQTLFEIEIYQNPQKDANKIYLKYLNQYSPNNSKNNGRFFLSNQDILYKSFSQLIYAVAYTNTLTSYIK